MNYYFIKSSANYADEFDVDGFQLLIMQIQKSEETLEDFEKNFYNQIENESIEIEDRQELKNCVTIKQITEEEYNCISKLIGTNYGHTLF
jgi:hypothetical protein